MSDQHTIDTQQEGEKEHPQGIVVPLDLPDFQDVLRVLGDTSVENYSNGTDGSLVLGRTPLG